MRAQTPSTLSGWASVAPTGFRFGGPGLGGLTAAMGHRPGMAAPEAWDAWLTAMFPGHFGSFAPHHRDYWEWLWSIQPGVAADPFVAIWSRGHGKSTGGEAGTAAVGLRGTRLYGLYVCATQDNADKRVGNVAALLEAPAVARFYPRHAERALNKYGNSRGWRRNRLVTAGGFTVDAAGLDTAIRGLKFEDRRPDFIVLDDIDAKHDSDTATQKKLETIKHDILPASAPRAAVLALQNLIIPNGIFARLADGRADFLATRIVSGPHPAIADLVVERRSEPDGRIRTIVVGGTPTWEDRGLDWAQEEIDKDGFSAFQEECQHEVHEREGALWSKALLNASRKNDGVPPLHRIVVGVDPSGGGDDIGIVVAGLGHDGHVYVVEDRTQKGARGPLNWGQEAVQAYVDWKADRVVGERNYGGDMVQNTIKVAAKQMDVPNVSYRDVQATRGKDVRAEPVAALFEDNRAHLCGHSPDLEAELTGWVPGTGRSPNRLDAMVWAVTELAIKGGRKPDTRVIKYSS